MAAVEKALLAAPGVATARANLAAKRVAVRFDPGRTDSEALASVLERAGFHAAEATHLRDEEGRAHSADLLRRLAVAGFAAANIMLLSVSVWAGLASDMDAPVQSLFHWLSALIALPAILYAGQPFFRSARAALASGRLNMDVPISLGILLATTMSLVQTMAGGEQVYFDAAIMLTFFLLIGRYLDESVRVRAKGAAENLLGFKATTATVIGEDGKPSRLRARELVPGMRVLVAAGERIPVDGRIVAGMSDIDEGLITGEIDAAACGRRRNRPRRHAVNATTAIEVVATATDEGTLVAEIARLMHAAEQARGRYVRLADRAARLYAPAVHVLGALTFIGWMVAGAGLGAVAHLRDLRAHHHVPVRAGARGAGGAGGGERPAVRRGRHRKGAGRARAARRGRHRRVRQDRDAHAGRAAADRCRRDRCGRAAARGVPGAQQPPPTVEGAGEGGAGARAHPQARRLRGGDRRQRARCQSGAGRGTPRQCRLGRAQRGRSAGHALVPPRRCGAGAVHFEDALRTDAAAVIAELKRAGYTVELLSGDTAAAAGAAAAATGIDIFHGGARPDGKIARLATLKARGHKVLMIGDGLNDAPALAAGHASLSPSSAADISQTAAGAIFQGERLAPVIETIAVAQATRAMSLQNFAIALAYNALFVPLAMAGLVTPLIAALAMSFSSIAVTANALRLRTMRLSLKPAAKSESAP